MADVSALFAARKSKSKKKKKKGSAVRLLQREKDLDDEDDLGSGLGGDMEEGDWIEDDEEEQPVREQKFLLGKTVKDVMDIDDLSINEKSKVPETVESKAIKEEFHRARQQALAAPVKVEEPKKPDPSTQKYRPRAMLEAQAKQSGAAALKNMDNEAFFPSLGGSKAPKPANVTQSAWGKVDKSAIKPKPVPRVVPPVYLDADFIPAETFDGAKPGYAFRAGDQGTGYYWEGGDEAKDAANGPSSTETPKKEPVDAPIPPKPKAAEKAVEPPKKVDFAAPEEAKPVETPTVAPVVEEDDEDEFAELAKLKKKKKKKKKAEE